MVGVDEFVARSARSHFMQSRAWLEAFRDDRETIEHVVTRKAGEILACSGLRRVRGRLGGEKCFVDGGPVFDSDDAFEGHLADLLVATRGAAMVRLRPYLPAADGAWLRELLADQGFTLPPVERQSGYVNTLVLDLTRPIEALQAEFTIELRRNLRRARREGIEVEHVTGSTACREFAEMLVRAALCAGYAVPPARRIADFLGSIVGDCSRAGALLCARDRGVMRAGIVVMRAGRSLVYQWGARESVDEATAPLTHALHLEAMIWGQSQGFAKYDFGGLFSADGSSGVDRFKRSFGGEVQTMFGEALRLSGVRGWVASLRQGAWAADSKGRHAPSS